MDTSLLHISAAQELLLRRKARREFRSWCQLAGFQPAKHHDLIISTLQSVAESKKPRYVILLMPPGVAKSTYTSKLFIAWYLGFCPGNAILACSYSKDLATTFGRVARGYVDQHAHTLGYSLSGDTRAADEWETSTKGRYFCAGVGAGIAGHRADLGLIDDYLGNQEDADSKTIRDKQWNWFLGDFWPRISGTKAENDGSVVIIANRRHEDDLVGRLLKKDDNEAPIDPSRWEVIRLPFFAEENDPLGRAIGAVIWPEKFEQKADQVRRLPSRIRAGLYQQSPRPEDGDYFRLSWLKGYEQQDLPTELRNYAASDHACSEGKGDSTVFLFGGWDGKKLWILPRCWWEKANTGEVVRKMLEYGRHYDPLTWWAERGHISKSIGPFLREQMETSRTYLRIDEVVPARDKGVRARPAQGMCEFSQVMFPKFADWWPRAEEALLAFNGTSSIDDDWVDAFAHLAAGVARMIHPEKSRLLVDENISALCPPLTIANIRGQQRFTDRQRQMLKADR